MSPPERRYRRTMALTMAALLIVAAAAFALHAPQVGGAFVGYALGVPAVMVLNWIWRP